VREAAKQARRSRVPVVDEPVSTTQLSHRVSSSALTLVLHESATERLADVPLPDSGDVLLVVGPEGGITPEELDALRSSGARIVRLGPTVLRASTAAAVALGAIGVRTTRW
jgi:16S rRNA (uracil1498-N3)-methyltransferase